MITKPLRKAVPGPLRPLVRRGILFLLPSLRRLKRLWRGQLKRLWRRRNRLNRQLKRLWRGRLRPIWREPRQSIESPYRQYVFGRALRRFSALPHGSAVPRAVLSDLTYGWGYEGGSAKHEYASAFLRHAQSADGPILECGSGLSTILLGIVAQRNGNKVWSLEHNAFWVKKIQSTLKRHGIESVELCKTNLRDYGPYWWYDPPKGKMPKDFSLVVCDGPPAQETNMTPGGRYGMLPVMKSHLKPGCVVLLDDADRVGERKIIARWAEELGTDYRFEGFEKPFGIVSVGGKE